MKRYYITNRKGAGTRENPYYCSLRRYVKKIYGLQANKFTSTHNCPYVILIYNDLTDVQHLNIVSNVSVFYTQNLASLKTKVTACGIKNIETLIDTDEIIKVFQSNINLKEWASMIDAEESINNMSEIVRDKNAVNNNLRKAGIVLDFSGKTYQQVIDKINIEINFV